jgi:hypothetical protein
MPENDTMLSRSGRTDPAGKLISRFDIPVSEEMNDAAIAMAAMLGVPKAELLREALEEALFGKFNVMRARVSRSSPARPSEECGS